MENTQFHKHICSIIENHSYDYFEHDMEYIIESMMDDPDFELSDEYKTTEEYYNYRKKALKLMMDDEYSHFDDYMKYLFISNRFNISLPSDKNELMDLFQFCKDKEYHSLPNGFIKCYGMHVFNNYYGNDWIIKKLHKFAKDNQNLSKQIMKKLFPIYFTEFLEDYNTKKISDIEQVRDDYMIHFFSKKSKFKINESKSALEYLQMIEYLDTVQIIDRSNFYTKLKNIQSIYLSNIADDIYKKDWFLERIKIRAMEIILQNPIIQFRYRDRILCKQYEKEFSQIIQ